RTYTQQLHNIRFVYCGSKRSLMTEMFLDAKRPFFSSSNMLNLDKIDREIYGSFIKRLFGKYDIPVDDDALTFILDWTRCHTFYTQNLCNVIFSMEPSRVNLKVARESALYILEREAYNFLQYRELVTTQQWLMLIGIAKEGSVSKITSSEFLRKYDIGSVTNAKRIVESLVQKDMLLQTVGIKETSYQVYNVFFSRWLECL
ncbi:MAG: ATPase, partial [Fibrobacter sp.]|nr:ATPase [Fibrobacter sp.]